MVNALKKIFSILPAGKYAKSTHRSTDRRHQENQGTRGLQAQMVRALGALLSLWSKKNLLAEKTRETRFGTIEMSEKWTKDDLERETTVARERVQDAEAAIGQELKDMITADSSGSTTEMPERTF